MDKLWVGGGQASLSKLTYDRILLPSLRATYLTHWSTYEVKVLYEPFYIWFCAEFFQAENTFIC